MPRTRSSQRKSTAGSDDASSSTPKPKKRSSSNKRGARTAPRPQLRRRAGAASESSPVQTPSPVKAIVSTRFAGQQNAEHAAAVRAAFEAQRAKRQSSDFGDALPMRAATLRLPSTEPLVQFEHDRRPQPRSPRKPEETPAQAQAAPSASAGSASMHLLLLILSLVGLAILVWRTRDLEQRVSSLTQQVAAAQPFQDAIALHDVVVSTTQKLAETSDAASRAGNASAGAEAAAGHAARNATKASQAAEAANNSLHGAEAHSRSASAANKTAVSAANAASKHETAAQQHAVQAAASVTRAREQAESAEAAASQAQATAQETKATADEFRADVAAAKKELEHSPTPPSTSTEPNEAARQEWGQLSADAKQAAANASEAGRLAKESSDSARAAAQEANTSLSKSRAAAQQAVEAQKAAEANASKATQASEAAAASAGEAKDSAAAAALSAEQASSLLAESNTTLTAASTAAQNEAQTAKEAAANATKAAERVEAMQAKEQAETGNGQSVAQADLAALRDRVDALEKVAIALRQPDCLAGGTVVALEGSSGAATPTASVANGRGLVRLNGSTRVLPAPFSSAGCSGGGAAVAMGRIQKTACTIAGCVSPDSSEPSMNSGPAWSADLPLLVAGDWDGAVCVRGAQGVRASPVASSLPSGCESSSEKGWRVAVAVPRDAVAGDNGEHFGAPNAPKSVTVHLADKDGCVDDSSADVTALGVAVVSLAKCHGRVESVEVRWDGEQDVTCLSRVRLLA